MGGSITTLPFSRAKDNTVNKKPFDTATLLTPLDQNIPFAPVRRPSLEEEMKEKESREPILATRETTHGDYEETARISQGMKEWYRSSPGWVRLTDIERESMDMIAVKIARTLSGRSMFKEHWLDLAGYAKLVEEKCKS
jgi:hypothetical protein